jgi:hypothetical protein
MNRSTNQAHGITNQTANKPNAWHHKPNGHDRQASQTKQSRISCLTVALTGSNSLVFSDLPGNFKNATGKSLPEAHLLAMGHQT